MGLRLAVQPLRGLPVRGIAGALGPLRKEILLERLLLVAVRQHNTAYVFGVLSFICTTYPTPIFLS